MSYKTIASGCALAALLSLFCGNALADDPAGSVRSVSGEATLARGGAAPVALKPGDRIFEKDVLSTGKAASLGLVMRDNSTLSLGPTFKLTVERYMFAPEKGAMASVLRLSKGSAACVTGEMARLSPESTKVLTPTYTIGIRGTHFLVNVEEGAEEAKEPAK